MQKKKKKEYDQTLQLCNLPVVTREDLRLIELVTNGGYWAKCDSPLSNLNIHIGNSWDIHSNNHAIIYSYFYRQWSNGECLLIQWFYYPRPVLAFGYCHRLRLWVCVSVCVYVCVYQSRACPHDNSSPIQARITKFGPEMQNTLV